MKLGDIWDNHGVIYITLQYATNKYGMLNNYSPGASGNPYFWLYTVTADSIFNKKVI